MHRRVTRAVVKRLEVQEFWAESVEPATRSLC